MIYAFGEGFAHGIGVGLGMLVFAGVVWVAYRIFKERVIG